MHGQGLGLDLKKVASNLIPRPYSSKLWSRLTVLLLLPQQLLLTVTSRIPSNAILATDSL